MKTELFVYVDERGLRDPQRLIKSFEGKRPGRYKVTQEEHNKRSIPQNAYLHAVLLPIVRDALRDAGWSHIRTIDHAKDYIKVKFLMKEEVNEQTGEIMQTFRNTSDLSKVEMNMLYDEVAVWLWDYFNIRLPMPGEQTQLFLLASYDEEERATIIKKAS
jgi:hypothetical protein